MKSAKRMVAKVKKAKAKKNMDTYFLRAKFNLISTAVQGATVNNYVYAFFPLMNATNTIDATQNTEFKLFQTLYDQVRINSVTIKVVPKANVLSQLEAQKDSEVVAVGDGLIHTAIDRDGSTPWNVGALQKYSSYKAYNLKRPFTKTYGIKWPPGVWLDCQNIYEDTALLKRIGALGGVTMYAENLIEDLLELINEPWANLYITYNCVFRGKTSAAITMDGSGNVVLSTLDLGDAPAYSPMFITAGSFNNTRLIETPETGAVTTAENDFSQP